MCCSYSRLLFLFIGPYVLMFKRVSIIKKKKNQFLVGVFFQWRGGVREDDVSVPGTVLYVVNFPASEGWQADSIRPNGKTVASKT